MAKQPLIQITRSTITVPSWRSNYDLQEALQYIIRKFEADLQRRESMLAKYEKRTNSYNQNRRAQWAETKQQSINELKEMLDQSKQLKFNSEE